MARVTSKGQVTIPKEVRDKLGIGPGSNIGFEEQGGHVVLVRAEEVEGENKGARLVRKLAEFGERARRNGCATCAPSRARRRPMARPSASSKRCCASGPTAAIT